jgi:hypothetical protein
MAAVPAASGDAAGGASMAGGGQDGGAEPGSGPPAKPVTAAAARAANRQGGAESPFADPVTGQFRAAPVPANYPRNLASAAGGGLAIALGIASVLESGLIPLAAVITALIGLAAGLWGLRSRRRTLSGIGIAICCVALAIGTYRSAVEIYIYQTGIDPFAPNEIVPQDQGDGKGEPGPGTIEGIDINY